MSGAPTVVRETGEPFGRADVRLVCSCGRFATDAYPLDQEPIPTAEMRGHLVDAHGAAIDAGRCANCRRPTDSLRVTSTTGELDDAWLCELCAPAPAGLETAAG